MSAAVLSRSPPVSSAQLSGGVALGFEPGEQGHALGLDLALGAKAEATKEGCGRTPTDNAVEQQGAFPSR
jgi:hypothetical protein